jgi:EF hand
MVIITNVVKAIVSSLMVLFVILAGIWALGGIAVAQKDSVPKPQDKLALGEDEVERLLLLIDTNKTGKIKKQEWMKFMEEEFDRLDKNKSGEIDAKELARSRLRARPFPNVGK